MYINYAAFARMRPCQNLVMGFLGAWEVAIYIMLATGEGESAKAINQDVLSMCLFYTLVTFSATKLLCATLIHPELKRA